MVYARRLWHRVLLAPLLAELPLRHAEDRPELRRPPGTVGEGSGDRPHHREPRPRAADGGGGGRGGERRASPAASDAAGRLRAGLLVLAGARRERVSPTGAGAQIVHAAAC